VIECVVALLQLKGGFDVSKVVSQRVCVFVNGRCLVLVKTNNL
jgi:hypothetical protein